MSPMTVRELKELLSKEDDDRIVILSKDAEGNDFSPLCELGNSSYEATSTWSGDIGIEKLTPKLIKEGYSKNDLKPNGVPALVLWPVN